MAKFRKRDNDKKDKMKLKKGTNISLPTSDEVYMLSKHKWIILSRQENINYSSKPKWDNHFRFYIDTYKYESILFDIDKSLMHLRNLKYLYKNFNNANIGYPENALLELDELIKIYKNSGYDIFVQFANLLETYRVPISNSFITVEKKGKNGTYISRLSNGPIENLNRKPKDLKRNSRGIRNFKHARNRILFALGTEFYLLKEQKSRY